MASLITADDFFLAAISILKKNGVEVLPLGDELDKKFAQLYNRVFQSEGNDLVPTFSFRIDQVHGNSRGFRETMYAARFNNIVSLENPSFHRLRIKLSSDDAEYLAGHSKIAPLMQDNVISVFSDNIANAKLSN